MAAYPRIEFLWLFLVTFLSLQFAECNYIGCFRDAGTRLLPNNGATNFQLTPAICISSCASSGMNLAGLENGNQCWCGTNNGAIYSSRIGDSNCNMACSGDGSQMCGGSWALSVYQGGGGGWGGAGLGSSFGGQPVGLFGQPAVVQPVAVVNQPEVVYTGGRDAEWYRQHGYPPPDRYHPDPRYHYRDDNS